MYSRGKCHSGMKCFGRTSNFLTLQSLLILILSTEMALTFSSSSAELIGSSSSSILASISAHRHRHHGEDHTRSRIRRFGEISQSSQPLMESYVNTRQTDLYTTYKVDEAVSRVAHENLHKPNFTNCGSYHPQIYEGQPVNTSVIQVEATDRDPPASGGNVTYSVVDISDVFSVEQYSGWVRTKKIFDRDEPSREREVYVTVRATDNGRPQLDAVCTMKVKILDINDNKPMFDKYAYRGVGRKEYKESIPRDLAVGQVVMRISATDIDDGNNGTVQYRLESHSSDPSDIEYFDIVAQNGEVTLKKPIQESKGQYFLTAIAADRGSPPLYSTTNLSVFVVGPNKKPPTFIENYPILIELPERSVDHSKPILTLEARSNTEDQIVFFELVNGQTQPTNKDAVFTLESEGNIAHVKLDRPLDYESVSEYTLTIRASNKYNLATETLITVKVKDENDEKPYFTEVVSGSVLENERPGTPVMRTRAIDIDGTAPNNEVTYYLKEEDRENFHIDSFSGEITTRKEFDREEQDIYQLTVIARDGAPSALLNNGQPNERPLTLKIEIADKNDNKPLFIKELYVAEVTEDANLNSKVIEVRAIDNDTASVLTYTITEGDPDNSFTIESTSTSGVVLISKSLDYEKVRRYDLTIKASDSVYDAYTKVRIQVTNVNDNPPVFEEMETNTTIVEESIPSGCIFVLKAFDPDIGDRTQSQNITFFVQIGSEHFSVNDEGCVRVIKPLDRDPPNGYQYPQAIIGAYDEWGMTTTKLASYISLTVDLIDINDNAPYLNSTNPVVWYENKPRGVITQLTADDADTPQNGPPFTFAIDPAAESDIKTLFNITGSTFSAIHDKFDREQRREYLVPIVIKDSGVPQLTGTSILTVIIGDENDNPMKPGESKILVYKYRENSSFTIGRVYVDDLDDWDLNDKTFYWLHRQHDNFNLDPGNGNINMKPSTREDTYRLEFKTMGSGAAEGLTAVINQVGQDNPGSRLIYSITCLPPFSLTECKFATADLMDPPNVRDSKWDAEVKAVVNVTVKLITEEAVDSSGSIRFMGVTKEQFIKPDRVNGRSSLDKLRTEIASMLEIENEDNVDVFTVITSPHSIDQYILDVRYSARNSPLYQAERLDGIMGQNKERLEKALELNILMIRIDECLKERVHCESSCTNNLTKIDTSYKIFTNTSSFVGVNAIVDPVCTCATSLAPNSCQPNPCLYGGICLAGGQIEGFKCDCGPGYEGPRCEITSISFEGTGWAWYPPLSVCNDSSLTVHFNTPIPNGLLMYNGPMYSSVLNVSDFMSLELSEGRPVFLLDFGSGVQRLELRTKSLADSKNHFLALQWNPFEISMRVDECPLKDKSCYTAGSPLGPHGLLNVNGPLQLGGLSFNLRALQPAMKWNNFPKSSQFTGCISNVSLNGQYYNLGNPSYSKGNVSSCDAPRVGVQTATIGVDLNFIIILLVCLLVLLILVIAIVFYRRRRSYEEVKGDPHDDVRENIINYSDEGGGEGDQTGYDLSVLMKASNGPYIHSPIDKIPMEDLGREGRVPENSEGPDIQSFLQGNKNKVDNDPDGLPYDDVRNYAYEGDGNSMGSLSSLASGTDDGDLNFDYLPTFGPRFKKLADMYGGQSSDDESYSGPPPEAWC